MAATAANSSSPSVRCSLLPHRPIPSRPSFFKPISSVNTNRSIGFSGLSSSPSPTAIPLQRWGCFPTLAREGKLRLRMPAVSGSLGGNEDETDQEAAVTDTESGATIDLKLPRRRLLVQFTCNECGERTNRLVNRLAYERGCLRHHKLVDNLGLIVEYDLREETNVKFDKDEDTVS
ncbi:uncharacterized protein LOC116210355 isoform X2 [Punica granatum]|uniref:Uncharacterized protein LOC116210355 isoform X2 n=1 Tax=Punica granatum TaxID=22663 RepID=A0A6P8DRQ6_PUNGR|nr:uncharacterized protein LOC116210355 isoform X2 [Punica granatum]